MKLSQASPVLINGNTTGASNDGHSSGCSAYGAGSGDLVYAVIAASSGTLLVDYACNYNGHVYVRSDCANVNSEVGCDKSDADQIQLKVAPGQPYFVVMDGGASEEGSFTLTLTLQL